MEELGVTGVEEAELKQRYSTEVLAEGTKTIRGDMWLPQRNSFIPIFTNHFIFSHF